MVPAIVPVNVTPDANAIDSALPVRLSVTVLADQGGSVSLFANDVAVASCTSMAIAVGISCSTNALPSGLLKVARRFLRTWLVG